MTGFLDIYAKTLASNQLCEEYDLVPFQLQIMIAVVNAVKLRGIATNEDIRAYFNTTQPQGRTNELAKDLCKKGILKTIPRPKQNPNFKFKSYYYVLGPKFNDIDLRYKQILYDIVNPPVNNSLLGL